MSKGNNQLLKSTKPFKQNPNFICALCNKPKSLKQISNKTICDKPICKRCVKK